MMTAFVRLGSLLLLVSSGRGRLVIDDLEDFLFNQTLERFMIHIGVSDLSFLVGAEMKYLATG